MSFKHPEIVSSQPFILQNDEIVSGDKAAKESQESPSQTQPEKRQATRMQRSTYVVWLVLFYAALVISSWTIICMLSYHPLTADRYSAGWIRVGSEHDTATYIRKKFEQNENWYQAARIIQSITAVLTIPLTSTVCSSAVVVYLQHRPGRKTPSFTLRQLTVLADKGWTNIPTLFGLVTGNCSRYFSLFLLWAVILHILGAVISPVQQIFLTTETVKRPVEPHSITQLFDIPDVLKQWSQKADTSTVPVVRSSLATTSGLDMPPQLWTRTPSCRGTDNSTEESGCSVGGTSWGNMSTLFDPFIAQLPKDTETGLMQQFLPRLNSTAEYQDIPVTEFPTDCETLPGALSIRLDNSPGVPIPSYLGKDPLEWAVHACMPTDLRNSPWKSTQSRQDFGEELFLNISLSASLIAAQNNYEESDANVPLSAYFRITTNTTAGFFELPNYMNHQRTGPILKNDPNEECGANCMQQNADIGAPYHLTKRENTSETNMKIGELEHVAHKGPLLTIALALFGPSSWFDVMSRFPSFYDFYDEKVPDGNTFCMNLAPLGRLLEGDWGEGDTKVRNTVRLFKVGCISPGLGAHNKSTFVTQQVGGYLAAFRAGVDSGDNDTIHDVNKFMSNVFTTAAYLSHQAWISATDLASAGLSVSYNMGADTQKPAISLAGIVLISILIGIDLLGLLATALYAAWYPRWTCSLDAFSLLRIGGTIGELVPLKISLDDDKVAVLDELPGWIGDRSGDGQIGQVGLGGQGCLQPKAVYEGYDSIKLRKRNLPTYEERHWG